MENCGDTSLSAHSSPEQEADITADALSTELLRQRHEDIELRREREIPTTFVIPPSKLGSVEEVERTLEIQSGQVVRFEGRAVRYKGTDVRMLNVVFAEEGPISLSGVSHHLNAYTTMQRRAICRVMQTASSPERGSFIQIFEKGNETFFERNPNVAFVDRRVTEKSRAELIQSMCHQYTDDPYVMHQAAPVLRSEHIQARNGSYDSAKLKSLGGEAEAKLLDELNEIIDRHKEGRATLDEQRQAVIAFNKLVYSIMPLARYMVLESTGNMPGRRRTPLSGFLRRMEGELESTEDAMQFAALGVIRAIQNYNKSKGNFIPYTMMIIGYEVREGVLEAARHTWGHTTVEVIENNGIGPRRLNIKDEQSYEQFSANIVDIPGEDAEKEYEQMLSSVTARSTVLKAMRSSELEPVERLILSLTTGVYMEEFEDHAFTSSTGRQFRYDSQLMSNPLFRQGLPATNVAEILGTDVKNIRDLRRAAMERLENALRQQLSRAFYREKWQGDICSWLLSS